MLSHITARLNSLNQFLAAIEIREKDYLLRSRKALELLTKYDAEFKLLVKQGNLKTQSNEIHYFKIQRPQLLSNIIYYSKIYHLETNKPIGSLKKIRKYYRKQLKKIDAFFLENRDFINYIRSGETIADVKMFTRNNIDYISVKESTMAALDQEQTTNFDHKLAKFYACERLEGFLFERITAVNKMLRKLKGLSVNNSSERSMLGNKLEELMTSDEVLRKLKISERKLQYMRDNGEIPYGYIGKGIYYLEKDIFAVYAASRKNRLSDDE